MGIKMIKYTMLKCFCCLHNQEELFARFQGRKINFKINTFHHNRYTVWTFERCLKRKYFEEISQIRPNQSSQLQSNHGWLFDRWFLWVSEHAKKLLWIYRKRNRKMDVPYCTLFSVPVGFEPSVVILKAFYSGGSVVLKLSIKTCSKSYNVALGFRRWLSSKQSLEIRRVPTF